MSDTYAPVAPGFRPVVTDNAPPRPPVPWIVNENREPLPEAVANGTWREVYPEPAYAEGPQKMTTKAHSRHMQVVMRGLQPHLETRQAATGQPFALTHNIMLTCGRVARLPDLVLYLEDPDRARHLVQDHFNVREDGPPDLVMEFLSRATWANDVGTAGVPDAHNKVRYYARMGIAEYWIVNPHREDIPEPRLQGFRRDGDRGVYVPIQPDAAGYWRSEVLATAWGVDDEQWVRLWDPDAQTWYPFQGLYQALREAETTVANLKLKRENSDLKHERSHLQQRLIDPVLQVAAREGQFTPAQLDAYRAALRVLDVHRIPDAFAFRAHLRAQPEASGRHAAATAYLNSVLGRAPDAG